MKFYLAPLEGITGYVYRNSYHAYFAPLDKYFTPFIATTSKDKLKTREKEDILPEHNEGKHVIPQLLSNNASDFIRTCKKIKDQYGYDEINLNLGCPSKTVVAKYRGAGFLAKPEELDRFLDEVFQANVADISIKTRLGIEDEKEFYPLLEIYNKYPLKELIIHPRVQKDFYNNSPRLDMFEEALELSKNPLCYNGDINTVEDYEKLIHRFPSINLVMIGRGIIRNPGLINEIKGMGKVKKEVIQEFHNSVYHTYKEAIPGDINVLYKMKEFWIYMGKMFNANEKYLKKIKKAQKIGEYEEVVKRMFLECNLN